MPTSPCRKTCCDTTRYGSIDSLIAKMPEVSLQLNDGSLYKAKGRIETVSGVVDPATGAVQIKALFPNPERELLSGSIGNIVLRNPQTDAITIPTVFMYRFAAGLLFFFIIHISPALYSQLRFHSFFYYFHSYSVLYYNISFSFSTPQKI